MRKKYRPESDSRTSDTGTGTDHHAGTSTGTFCSLCRIYAAEGSSFEWLTIYENVLLGLKIQKRKTKESISHVDRLLQEYGLWNFRFSHPSQLSGGMRQRAALIRTLALEPALLLLDEPFSALDYQTRLSVSDDIWKILRKEGKTALLVTHDISEAISMSDRVIILSKAPACVRCEFPILTTLADRTPMQMRNAPEFKQYFQQIWKELNHDT